MMGSDECEGPGQSLHRVQGACLGVEICRPLGCIANGTSIFLHGLHFLKRVNLSGNINHGLPLAGC